MADSCAFMILQVPVKLRVKNGKAKVTGLRDEVDAMVGDLRKSSDGKRKNKRTKGNSVNEE